MSFNKFGHKVIVIFARKIGRNLIVSSKIVRLAVGLQSDAVTHTYYNSKFNMASIS